MPILISMLYPKLFVKEQSKSKKDRDLKKSFLLFFFWKKKFFHNIKNKIDLVLKFFQQFNDEELKLVTDLIFSNLNIGDVKFQDL